MQGCCIHEPLDSARGRLRYSLSYSPLISLQRQWKMTEGFFSKIIFSSACTCFGHLSLLFLKKKMSVLQASSRIRPRFFCFLTEVWYGHLHCLMNSKVMGQYEGTWKMTWKKANERWWFDWKKFEIHADFANTHFLWTCWRVLVHMDFIFVCAFQVCEQEARAGE